MCNLRSKTSVYTVIGSAFTCRVEYNTNWNKNRNEHNKINSITLHILNQRLCAFLSKNAIDNATDFD